MDKTLYVVSGYMRTGTTMMMKALEAGGLDAYYTNKELRELSPTDFHPYDFPRQYEGRLIKCMGGALVSAAVMPYGMRVVFMMRDPREIEDSYEKMFGKGIYLDNYHRDMLYIIDRLNNRRDVKSLTVLEYKDVVSKPLHSFKRIKDEGWDISCIEAACIPKQELYRSRL